MAAAAFLVLLSRGGEKVGEGEGEGEVGVEVVDETFARARAVDEAELPITANNGWVANAGEMKEDVHGMSSASSGISAHVETKLAGGCDGGDVGGPVLETSGMIFKSSGETEVDFGVFASKTSVTNTFAIGFAAVDKRCDAAVGEAGEVGRLTGESAGSGRFGRRHPPAPG